MFQVTKGVNTHKGAIWSLGLITAAAAIHFGACDEETLCFTAGEIAHYEDRFIPFQRTNGMKVIQKYGVLGAKAEAQLGFPTFAITVCRNSSHRYNVIIMRLQSFARYWRSWQI